MWNMLVLPPVQTQFEIAHLRRMNRVALAFFWANLPVFVAVALLNGTGALSAAALTGLVLAGPTLAYALLDNQRSVSVVQGITAMCLGGLLVHFGQGPVQIEMHFYFFSLLAVLSVFGNPMVIVAAAVTVTLHHTVIWLLLPRSVFNYDASFWVVGVHATFVVVESVAAVFIARSFFDNVIGLEQIVEARTRDLDAANRSMRLVLENVNQGLLTVDRAGRLAPERSAKVDAWFGEVSPSHLLADLFERVDATAAQWFQIGWDDLIRGDMPQELVLDQLPRRVVAGGRHLSFDYVPIATDGAEAFERLLVVVSDVTADVAKAAADAEHRQTMAMFDQFLTDRRAFLEFFQDAAETVSSLALHRYPSREVGLRWIHTLKGNALTFGLEPLGEHLHALETRLVDEQRAPTAEEIDAVSARWRTIAALFDKLSGEHRDELRLERKLYDSVVGTLTRGEPTEALTLLRQVQLDPVEHRLGRIAAQARRIAGQLGDVEVEVITRPNGVLLEPNRWAPFWSVFVHLVRNAVDHGLEPIEERERLGKPRTGRLEVSVSQVDGTTTILLRDDGRGIDWERVRDRAREIGLPHATPEDLQHALFADGFSTRAEASTTSGRGFGLSAVDEVTRQLGGWVTVSSERGAGTTFAFHFPAVELAA